MITNVISQIFGLIANYEFPRFIQNRLNYLFIKTTGIDMMEFGRYDEYVSINALFTRRLKMPRTIEDGIISPSDSLVNQLGKIKKLTLFQVKGSSYSVEELLQLPKNKYEYYDRLEGGDYINFYLSPKDYHRYHAPTDMHILSATHIKGVLKPVNFKYLNKIPSLYTKNERVILECIDKNGKIFFMVFVGALNVGKMKFNFDFRIDTNFDDKPEPIIYEYSDIFVKKGEELGYFKMGSTIVILYEKNAILTDIKPMTKVKYGQKIANLRS